MNRIRDATFILITVLAIVFLLGGYFLLEDKNRLIETTQKELKGLELNSNMVSLLLAMEGVNSNNNTVDKAVSAIDELDPTGTVLPLKKWTDFKTAINGNANDISGNVKTLMGLMRDVGDNSTLILDPEMASYYLVDITVNQIPPIIEHIAQNRRTITKAMAAHAPLDATAINRQLNQFAPLQENLNRAANIVQATKTVKGVISTGSVNFMIAHDYYVKLLTVILDKPGALSAQQFLERSNEVIYAYTLGFNTSADLLSLHLKQRIKENRDGRLFTIFFLFFIYCYVIAIGYFALRNYVQKQEVIAARELTHMMERLERTNNELEHFAYVASHDLKEPLRTIGSFAKLLQQKYSAILDETGQNYLGILMTASARMQHMISDLLDYARIDYELSKSETFDCAAEVQHVLENLKQPIEQSGVQITVAPLPTITHHAAQFMRLMQNLISNAIKYRREGVTPQIHIGCEDKPECWEFSVQDNGIGIDKAYFERIFQPFKRLHTQQQFEGTGIGLAICKKVVERMGGMLWLTSKPDEGSTFYFTIMKRIAR